VIEIVPAQRDSYGRDAWKPAQDGQLVITINGHSNRIRLWEKGVGLRAVWEREKEYWEQERLNPRSFYLSRPTAYDGGATGALNVAVLGYSHRQTTWGDRKRWHVEDRLPQLLREIEVQAVEAEERRLAREREEAERKRRWEAAMERAKKRLVDAHHVEVLSGRVRAWREAEAIRAYCDAVEARYGTAAVEADRGASQWLAFARARADSMQALPTMPPTPEVTAEALRPFLDGWSPYGP
jgi:hypothetical protein